ncbi:MAG: helix-turn-helix domain-containing protein [Parvularculaceae bacterium]
MGARDLTASKNEVSIPSIESPFYSAEEAALYLRISRRSLEHFRCDGGGPAYRKHGGTIVYHVDDLERWSAARRYNSTSEKSDK